MKAGGCQEGVKSAWRGNTEVEGQPAQSFKLEHVEHVQRQQGSSVGGPARMLM